MAAVQFEELGKSYGSVEVIRGINLDIAPGEFVVLVGASGCGKSTMLRMTAGLETVSSGTIRIGGKVVNDLPPVERGIAMVFQSYALYPHMTVFQNMSFSLKQVRTPKAEIERRVGDAANLLQIGDLLHRFPRQLSGGQRQRVAIGRAIVRQPQVFLFDEPLSNLDASLRSQMRAELSALHRRLGATMVYVTHDQVEAMTMADRIVLLDKGNVEQVGTPRDVYETPGTRYVAQFIGSPRMNILEAVVAEPTAGHLALDFGAGTILEFPAGKVTVQPGARVSLGVRPEHVSFADRGGLAGSVQHLEYLGDELIVHVALATGAEVVAKAPVSTSLGLGENVRLAFEGTACHLFDVNGLRVDGIATRTAKPRN